MKHKIILDARLAPTLIVAGILITALVLLFGLAF